MKIERESAWEERCYMAVMIGCLRSYRISRLVSECDVMYNFGKELVRYDTNAPI